MTRPDPMELARISPTECRPGEDVVARFMAEITAVQGTVERVRRDQVAAAVARAVRAEDAQQVALTVDLDAHRRAIAEALADEGVGVVDYAEVARDRDRLGRLDATVTGCQAAVAATGSILTGAATAGRAGALIAPLHVCLVEERRIFPGLLSVMRALPDLAPGSALALQSGPSRTADIEKTLILGMHGPRTVHVVIVEDGG